MPRRGARDWQQADPLVLCLRVPRFQDPFRRKPSLELVRLFFAVAKSCCQSVPACFLRCCSSLRAGYRAPTLLGSLGKIGQLTLHVSVKS